jgi:hypothetical protein
VRRLCATDRKRKKAADERPLDHEGKPPSGPNASFSRPGTSREPWLTESRPGAHFLRIMEKADFYNAATRMSTGFVNQISDVPDLHRMKVYSSPKVN